MATAKHFAVHGQPEGGTNVGTGNYSERVPARIFPEAFRSGGETGARRDADGVVQRDRRHPFARQQTLARRHSATRVGIPRAGGVRLFRD